VASAEERPESYRQLPVAGQEAWRACTFGENQALLFQPHTIYLTLDFDNPLSTHIVQKIVKRWADYSRLRDLSAHDLRLTAITRALESGLTCRQVQMMSKHRDPKTVIRYDYGQENLDQNAANFLVYDDE
jgi:integrase